MEFTALFSSLGALCLWICMKLNSITASYFDARGTGLSHPFFNTVIKCPNSNNKIMWDDYVIPGDKSWDGRVMISRV